MTREQVETEMAQYRTIFTVVRLLDAAQVGGEESINSFCSCYSYWGKNTPCRNCISRQVLEDHRQRTKLEYMGSEVFQVTAVYREVDGVPCVMELVQKLDGETLIDPENGDRLIDSIASYHTKLYHDALTDSYNRLYFEDALKDKTDPAGVAVLDLDDFKLINDTYGHQAGDTALRTCVDVVRACIRKSDVLIRYGGDEFLLVLPGIERAAFLAKLDRIREQLHTASVPGYSRLQLSASIGGVITQPGETVEQAVSRADKLMYQAKNRKNMVVTEDNARDGALSAAGRESHSRQSILIVDDSEMNRAILAEILGGDYNILEATNGRECLAMLEQYGTGIALILLDIVMPVMDGFALAEACHKDGSALPAFIMLTSYEEFDYVKRSMRLGVVDYLVKIDLTADSLTAALEHARATAEKEKKLRMPSPAPVSLDTFRDRLFLQLYGGLFTDRAVFDRQCAELGVTFKAPRHIVAVGSLQTPDLPTSQLVTLSTGVTRMAAETLPKYRPCRVTAMDLRHFSVLLPLEADEDPEAVLAPILKTAGQILYNYFSTAIYWAVGRPVNDILKISESQHDAFAALPLLHEGEPVAFYHESPNTQLDHRAQVVGQVQQYIRDHLSERLTLNDVAAVFNFSPNYLSQLFAQNSESGFVEFVTATRITAAKELMASTDLKVYEISDKVGFDSAFYFSKVFKKLEGVSPREYMQRMKVSYVDAKDEATV